MSITHNNMHINRPLSNLSVAFAQEFPAMSDLVFPSVSVGKQSDQYYIYDLGDWNRVNVQSRAPATESAGASWSLADDSYFCKPYALHHDIPYEHRANADAPLNEDSEAVAFLVNQMAMKKNLLWAADYFTTGIWTGSSTGTDIVPGTKWDAANATPIKDIRAQKRAMHTKTGMWPNTLVIGGVVWEAIQDQADFLDRLSGDERKLMTVDVLKRILEIERIFIADMIQTTSGEGAAATTTAEVFGERALLMHVAPRPGLRTPSAGYRFTWRVPGVPESTIKKMDMPLKNADRLEIQTYFDHKVVSPLLGCLFDNVLST